MGLKIIENPQLHYIWDASHFTLFLLYITINITYIYIYINRPLVLLGHMLIFVDKKVHQREKTK